MFQDLLKFIKSSPFICGRNPNEISSFYLRMVLTLFLMSFCSETEAVRPPLKPLSSEQLQKMIADADVIAIGNVISVKLAKTLHLPLETVMVHVVMTPERVLKGDRKIKNIVIEESYQQFSNNIEAVPDSPNGAEEIVTAHIAGPVSPVGKYRDGDRILVFLKCINELNQYLPLGSGNHDAYLGVFQITSEGVISGRYRLDEVVTGYAKAEADFINFIISNNGE